MSDQFSANPIGSVAEQNEQASRPHQQIVNEQVALDTETPKANSLAQKVKVWDFPLRLFHWSLVLLFIFSFVSVKISEMDWHFKSGILISALLVFRLLWGLVGSFHAKFQHFIASPKRTFQYIFSSLISTKRKHKTGTEYIGHNPAGGWMVVIMLVSLLVTVFTGLVSTDEIYLVGPLYGFVTESFALSATSVHRFMETVLLVLVGLHIAAIVFYRIFKQQKLTKAMITGYKQIQPESLNEHERKLLEQQLHDTQSKKSNKLPVMACLIVLAIATGWAAWLWQL
ncbi:cytochrome b/b6 domain-containing protein [Flocculibacter collagenilyticus]|uniref:cytochrome b/b6 domain-containing protein n=1 Tax=Flocculibacter collagenilyticus TaxID=2744479 RepID=UPI0018F5A74D|nr:cytochrome b/b6 domain-containing protein [Flocculibacter collagenilyticus]